MNNNPKVCYVGADARQSGTYQGEIVLALPNKGDVNGDGVVNYVMVVGDPENPDAQYRTEFSIKALTDAGVKVNELVKNVGNWDQAKGNEIVDAALAQHGKDYSSLEINPQLSYYENRIAASRWYVADNLSKLGKPVDRSEWGMSPL